jgi:hypothetical protein
MAIIIPNNRIEIPEMVKLYSNPVSGIACQMDPTSNYNLAHGGYYHLRNIRYSKSMILGALRFWGDQLFKMYLRVNRITNPLEPTKDFGEYIMSQIDYMDSAIDMIQEFPDSFLYSHRYIQPYDLHSHNESMSLQLKLLHIKYQLYLNDLRFQKGKMDPFTFLQAPYGIEFTVFPNEHPYIKRAVIAEVGQTSKGNTFIITKK